MNQTCTSVDIPAGSRTIRLVVYSAAVYSRYSSWQLAVVYGTAAVLTASTAVVHFPREWYDSVQDCRKASA